jgi:hypothetical protein
VSRRARKDDGPVFPRNARLLASLPIDIFINIRECITCFELLKDHMSNTITETIQQEQRRDWRSFLSMSNNQSWRTIRESAMIWSLNYYEAIKYLKDPSFRIYLQSRMINPERQLHCSLNSHPILNIGPRVMLDSNILCNLCCFQVSFLSIEEIPSSPTLRILSVRDCKKLLILGSYPMLQSLTLCHCSQVTSIGKTEALTHLHLTPTFVDLLGDFPLEQLECLHLRSLMQSFLQNISRLTYLKMLLLVNDYPFSSNNELPVLPFPVLHSLSVKNIELVNLSGFTSLKVLVAHGIREGRIIGLESVASQLISFSYEGNTHLRALEVYPQKIAFSPI